MMEQRGVGDGGNKKEVDESEYKGGHCHCRVSEKANSKYGALVGRSTTML